MLLSSDRTPFIYPHFLRNNPRLLRWNPSQKMVEGARSDAMATAAAMVDGAHSDAMANAAAKVCRCQKKGRSPRAYLGCDRSTHLRKNAGKETCSFIVLSSFNFILVLWPFLLPAPSFRGLFGPPVFLFGAWPVCIGLPAFGVLLSNIQYLLLGSKISAVDPCIFSF